jgi:RND family efflux transporter MFP subunit
MEKIRILWLPLLTTLIMGGCKTEIAVKKDEPVRIMVSQVEPFSINQRVIASGRISSKDEIKLSFKTGGIINNILVNEGDFVKKGQTLATLNLSEINAVLQQAKLGYEKAMRDYERALNLYNDSVATLEQMQNAKTALDYAKANVDVANFNFAHSTIVAPEDGTILKKLVSENEIIAQGYPVFLFGKHSQSWLLRVNVSDKEAVLVERGDSVEITLDTYPKALLKGVVTETGKFADPYMGTFEIGIKIYPKTLTLMSGLIARAGIKTQIVSNYILIPYNALIEANDREGQVYKIVNNEITKVIFPVERIIDEGILTQSNGIEVGDSIVTHGIRDVKPGKLFQIVEQF